ncbi:conserved uncharacterized protein [Stigmatella aurantiaca DW4/3-1]|uniref:Conserved uncharacterized protein n=2 Tax=Stigmatella aurantiaca TaxID=41 RepID=E3FWK6_STIAD|nr:conserved uncharacterized protein [Stigmatella aurantiaca DW4/3-1]
MAQLRGAPCQSGVRRIELPARPTLDVMDVCISPELSTTFVFDEEIARQTVTVEGAERFTRIEISDSTLRLIPSVKVLSGERLRLTLRFKGNSAPMGAAFWLAVHPAQAEALVEVFRQKRTVESCQQELADKDLQLRQCREENMRILSGAREPNGLVALLNAGLMDPRGISAKTFSKRSSPSSPGGLFEARSIVTYRSSQRVAVELWLRPLTNEPGWKIDDAALAGTGTHSLHVLSVRHQESLDEGALEQRVLIEAKATKEEAQGPFTLKLWDREGTRSIAFPGITFP